MKAPDWYYLVSQDLENIPGCLSYYETELEAARTELSLKGRKTIEKHGAELPGIIEHRYRQLQEVEAILEFLNIELRKIRSGEFKKFLEHYNRALTSRDCEKYIDGVEDVVSMSVINNEFSLLRNKYMSVFKALEQKSYMLGHIVRLRTAGLEDITIN